MADQGSFGIQIKGIEELNIAANKAAGDFPRKMYQAMVAATTLVQEEAKRVSPDRFKNRTGNLRRSIYKPEISATKGVVGVGETYGAYVEFGTKPHVIRPKKGRFLAFKSGSGKLIFARQINHPGSKPYPFMEPAFTKNIDPIKDIYDNLALEIVREVAL